MYAWSTGRRRQGRPALPPIHATASIVRSYGVGVLAGGPVRRSSAEAHTGRRLPDAGACAASGEKLPLDALPGRVLST